MAAESTAGDGWLEAILALPPPIQGVVFFGLAIGAGVVIVRRFLRRLKIEPETRLPKLYGAGEVSPLTDLEPFVSLVAQLDLLTTQIMKNEVTNSSFAGQVSVVAERLDVLGTKIGQLVDITGQLLVDMRLEREARADAAEMAKVREEGRQEALLELKRTTRRRSSRARAKPTGG